MNWLKQLFCSHSYDPLGRDIRVDDCYNWCIDTIYTASINVKCSKCFKTIIVKSTTRGANTSANYVLQKINNNNQNNYIRSANGKITQTNQLTDLDAANVALIEALEAASAEKTKRK